MGINEHVSVDRGGGVVRIRLDRPDALNAMTTASLLAIADAVEQADHDDVDVVVITGAGRAFCAGADLASIVDAATVAAANRVVAAIAAIGPPVIVAVNGPAVGVGASIALAGDLVVAVDSAYFLLPFLGIGLVPDGGATHAVTSLAGRARAARMAFGGERIGAATALEWGIVGEVVAADALDARIEQLVERILDAPRAAAVETKRLLRSAEAGALATALAAELATQSALLATPEYLAAREAFLAKRPITFRRDGARAGEPDV